jgi:hypothetical protein
MFIKNLIQLILCLNYQDSSLGLYYIYSINFCFKLLPEFVAWSWSDKDGFAVFGRKSIVDNNFDPSAEKPKSGK